MISGLTLKFKRNFGSTCILNTQYQQQRKTPKKQLAEVHRDRPRRNGKGSTYNVSKGHGWGCINVDKSFIDFWKIFIVKRPFKGWGFCIMGKSTNTFSRLDIPNQNSLGFLFWFIFLNKEGESEPNWEIPKKSGFLNALGHFSGRRPRKNSDEFTKWKRTNLG